MLALSEAGVDFIIVGMFGINFHARSSAEKYVTEDLDVLLEPSVSTLRRALAALSGAGFEFETGGEPFVDVADEEVLAAVLRAGATLRASFGGTLVVDLMLSMAGFSHEQVAKDAKRFRALGREIRVGSLEKLLESKRRSGRPKDLKFLEYYEAAAAPRPPSRKKKRKPK